MTLKFSQEDAQDMTRIIQRARPGWSPKAIITALEAAARNHTAGPSLTAALRAAKDPQAMTPAAILFEKYWTLEHSRMAPSGRVLCCECLTKHPADEMTRTPHGWTCNNCKENAA